jgi:hypothetical protein
MPRFGNYSKNLLVEIVSTLPTSPLKGRTVLLDTDNKQYYYNGTVWVSMGGISKYSADIGDGTLTDLPVTHNLNTKNVTVTVVEKTTGEALLTDWKADTDNKITVSFAVAPTAAQFTVTVIG